jgi:hypothetical protein
VREVDVVRDLVDLDPADGLAGLDTALDQRQGRAVGLDDAVAVPAGVQLFSGEIGTPSIVNAMTL